MVAHVCDVCGKGDQADVTDVLYEVSCDCGRRADGPVARVHLACLNEWLADWLSGGGNVRCAHCDARWAFVAPLELGEEDPSVEAGEEAASDAPGPEPVAPAPPVSIPAPLQAVQPDPNPRAFPVAAPPPARVLPAAVAGLGFLFILWFLVASFIFVASRDPRFPNVHAPQTTGQSGKLATGRTACLHFIALELGDRMRPGDCLDSPHFLVTPDGKYYLDVQDDGNLVVYRTVDQKALWASQTYGKGPSTLMMQPDGNLVLYRDKDGSPTWSSHTEGQLDAYAKLHDEGVFAVYTKQGSLLWQSGPRAPPSSPQPTPKSVPPTHPVVIAGGNEPQRAACSPGGAATSGMNGVAGDASSWLTAKRIEVLDTMISRWPTSERGDSGEGKDAEKKEPPASGVAACRRWIDKEAFLLRGDCVAPGATLGSVMDYAQLSVVEGRVRITKFNHGLTYWEDGVWGWQGRAGALILQDDCNLVLYGESGVVLWASGTQGKACESAQLIGDGTLRLLDKRRRFIWSTPEPSLFVSLLSALVGDKKR